MSERASLWRLDKSGNVNLEQMQQIWPGDTSGTAIVTPDTMAEFIFGIISKHRGFNPANLVNPEWATEIFKRQSTRWCKIAESHGDTIFQEMMDRIYGLVDTVAGQETSRLLLAEIIEPALQQR